MRKQEFSPRKPTNKRFLQAKYGMRRLIKVESSLESEKKLAARRYNKSYSTRWFILIQNAYLCSRVRSKLCREITCLWGIDDFSRELYAAILPDKTQNFVATFLKQVIEKCPCTIECCCVSIDPVPMKGFIFLVSKSLV